MSLRLATWNVQGHAGLDLLGVAEVLRARDPDVVALQEIRRRQALALAEELGWSVAWRWKHWPVVVPAEGLAILQPLAIAGVEVEVLAQPWAFWSSDRRVAMAASVTRGRRVVDVHLGAGVGDAERSRQARLVAGMAGSRGIIAGDLNTVPGSPVMRTFREAGFRDAWEDLHTEVDRGFTHWGGRPRHGPATRRIDYVLVGPDLQVMSAEVPAYGDSDFERYGLMSDHLPLTVTVAPR